MKSTMLALCCVALISTVASADFETPVGTPSSVPASAPPIPTGPAGGLASPGFESGPDVAVVSFTPTDTGGLLWFASNTDGERIKSVSGKIAAEGDFYASLLQNAGAYDGSPLGVGDFGYTGFDRIYATVPVDPLTTYVVSFQHAGDDRFGYLGDTSVVEVVDTGPNATITLETFPTPGLFDWQTESFSFSTGAGTTEVAIALTVTGAGNTSGVFDDLTVEPLSAVPDASAVSMIALLCGLLMALAWIVTSRRRSVPLRP